MKLEDLFEDDSLSFCDYVWLLSLLLLPSINKDNKSDIVVNVYMNGNKAGDK